LLPAGCPAFCRFLPTADPEVPRWCVTFKEGKSGGRHGGYGRVHFAGVVATVRCGVVRRGAGVARRRRPEVTQTCGWGWGTCRGGSLQGGWVGVTGTYEMWAPGGWGCCQAMPTPPPPTPPGEGCCFWMTHGLSHQSRMPGGGQCQARAALSWLTPPSTGCRPALTLQMTNNVAWSRTAWSRRTPPSTGCRPALTQEMTNVWLMTACQVVGRAEPHNMELAHPTQHRVLTIRENARAQVPPPSHPISSFLPSTPAPSSHTRATLVSQSDELISFAGSFGGFPCVSCQG
jgi:hypothetical protein